MRGFAIAALVGTSASLALLCLLRQKSSAEEEDDDEGDGEVLEPGMILLEFAKEVPDLLPIAFLVHAVVKNIDKEDAAARQFGQGVEALEVLILQATSLPPALLSRLAAALEKAEEAMRSGGQVAGSFAALGVELQACMDALEYDSAALADADFDPKDLFGGAMAAAIDSKRRAQAADEEQVKLLSERNRLLAEQVAARDFRAKKGASRDWALFAEDRLYFWRVAGVLYTTIERVGLRGRIGPLRQEKAAHSSSLMTPEHAASAEVMDGALALLAEEFDQGEPEQMAGADEDDAA